MTKANIFEKFGNIRNIQFNIFAKCSTLIPKVLLVEARQLIKVVQSILIFSKNSISYSGKEKERSLPACFSDSIRMYSLTISSSVFLSFTNLFSKKVERVSEDVEVLEEAGV